jgi:anti-sigma regulatory factor (Ser/Thr protein kinase)
MRAHAWSRTPLGDPSTWPASLTVACRLCLTSSLPTVLWWGPELCFFYNDAYRPYLGDKHPALGLPGSQVGGEVWQVIGGQLHSVLDIGTANDRESKPLLLNRIGYLEEAHYSYLFSPLCDDDGVVRGAVTAVGDTTGAIVAAQRVADLNDVARLRRHPDPLELTFPAGTDQLAPARAALRGWLARCDLTPRAAQDALIAAGEALANAYEHGCGGASGLPISLTAVATATDVYLTVTDSGRWKEAALVPGAFRGHGLPLMRALMTEVTVIPAAAGTTVRMRLEITP